MKLALLGSFPEYPFKKKLKLLYNNRPNVTTYWNVTLLQALSKHTNVELHFLTNTPVLFTQKIKFDRATVHFVGHPPKLTLIDNITQLRFSRYHFHSILDRIKPDLVYGIGTDHEYPYIAHTSKFRSIIKVGGLISEVVKKEKIPFFNLKNTFARYETYLIKNSKHIITPSLHVKSKYSKITNAKFHIVPNPVEDKLFSLNRAKKYDVIYAGKIYSIKRLKNLVTAIAFLHNSGLSLKVIVAGAIADKSYMADVQQLINHHAIQSLFTFTGSLNRENLIEAMACSKTLIVPSVQETAPMVISEAMAVGLPVIGTAVGGIPDMIQDKITGYVIPPDNVEMLANKIRELLQNKELRETMGRAARQQAKKNYGSAMVASQNMAAFEEVLNSEGPNL